MTELRRIYTLFSPITVGDLTSQMNRILGQLSERLDQIEGYRGTPTFKANIDFDGNKAINSAVATAATDVPQLDQIISITFPVGAVFLSVVSTNPNTLLGYGSWSQIGQGKYLVGFSGGDADFGTVEGTGGNKTANLAHTHNAPAHKHDMGNHLHSIDHTHGTSSLVGALGATIKDAAYTGNSGTPSTNDTSTVAAAATDSKLSATQSILNPYLVVYIWKRTA